MKKLTIGISAIVLAALFASCETKKQIITFDARTFAEEPGIVNTNHHVPPPLNTAVSQPSLNTAIQPSVLADTFAAATDSVMLMPKNGSLCGTLGMTREEALEFALEYKRKYWYSGQMLYVLVYPGEKFTYVEDDAPHWEPAE